jgi:ABC transport system ATP-binding/permease protein
VGGYSDWVRQRAPSHEDRDRREAGASPGAVKTRAPAVPSPRNDRKRKLTFKETNELASLPDSIDALERERDAVYASLADPALLRDGAATASAKERLAGLEGEIARRLARWEELETIAAG